MEKKLKVEYKKISDLIPYVNNTRTHSDTQVLQIASSIKEFGFTNPILIDDEGGVIAGHGRIMGAKKLGLDEAPTITLKGLTESQRKAYIIADNKLALNSGWDEELLKVELQALDEIDFDLSVIGFDEDELSSYLDDTELTEGLTDEDDVPEPPEKPVTREGDVWLLGKHRLMCGDSTSVDAVEKLMDGHKADMVFTDPPYGISHSGKGITANGVEGNDFGEILNDNDVSVALDNFNLANSLFPDATMIYWGANYYPQCLPNGFGWLFWDKETQGNTFSGGEIAFVNKGVRFDVFRHRWAGFCKASEQGQARVHPTQKPIELVKFGFENYNAGSCIVDFFLGSGSTLIASEATNRYCYGMELDPKYCDVIINRWQDFTGKQATLEVDGRTFEEVSND